MILEYVVKILEYAAKIAPFVTALAAIGALIFAGRSIWTQKNIARKRAAIDFFLKTEMDKEMLAAYDSFQAAIAELKRVQSLDDFERTKHYQSIRSYLNIHELLALGIRKEVFDEDVCYGFWRAELEIACRDTQKIIKFVQLQPDRSATYVELERLNEKWSKKSTEQKREQKFS